MKLKTKILQILQNDELIRIKHCNELLTEKDLTLEDVDFLSREISDSTYYVTKIGWYLSKGE